MRCPRHGAAHYSAFHLLRHHAHLPLQHLTAIHLQVVDVQPVGQIACVDGDLTLAVAQVEAAQRAAPVQNKLLQPKAGQIPH